MSDPFDQRLARVLVKPFVGTPLHPNHLTGLSLLFGVAAAAIFAFGQPGTEHGAALLYVLAVFIDHTDGELARASGKTSTFGHRFDYLAGSANYTMLFVGIGLGLFNRLAGDLAVDALVLGLTAGLANPIIVALRMQMELRYGKVAVEHPRGGGFEIEDFIYLIGPITWTGGLMWFFVLYGFGTIGYLFWTAGTFLRHGTRA